MNVIVVFTNPGHLIVADILDLACERDIASNPEDVNIQVWVGGCQGCSQSSSHF